MIKNLIHTNRMKTIGLIGAAVGIPTVTVVNPREQTSIKQKQPIKAQCQSLFHPLLWTKFCFLRVSNSVI